MKYLRLIKRNLFRNKRRTFLLFSSVAVSFFLIATLQTILNELNNPVETPASALRLIVRHHISMFNVLPESHRVKIAAVDGVDAVVGSMYYGAIYKDPANFLTSFAVDTDGFFRVYSDLDLPDDKKQAFIKDRSGAVVGNHLADRFNWKIGDTIFLESRHWPVDVEVTIRGVYQGGSDLGSILYFHWDYLNELIKAKLGDWDNTGTFIVRARSPKEITRVADRIDTMFQNSGYPTQSETERVFTLNYLSMFGDVGAYANSIISVMILTIVLMTANAMTMAITERVREIGVFKALGFRRSQVLALLLGESAVLSLCGALIGSGAAKLLYRAVDTTQITSGFIQRLDVRLTTLASCMLIGLLIGILSSGLQAWQASRLTVVEALRRVL